VTSAANLAVGKSFTSEPFGYFTVAAAVPVVAVWVVLKALVLLQHHKSADTVPR
jgi:hypothetical protein